MKTIVKRVTENIMSVDWKERVADIHKPKSDPISSEVLLADFINKRTAEGVQCYFFSPDRHEKGKAHDTSDIKKFLALFESADYLSIDNYMADKIPDTKYIYFSDTHPSPEMHAVLAGALFQELKPRVRLLEK